MNIDPGYLGFRAGSLIARAVPAPAVPRATHVLGTLATSTMSARRFMVERNLRRIYGPDLSDRDLRHKVEQTFDSYTRYWVESFRLPGTPAADLDRGLRTEGYEHIDAALEAGSGVILALPHLGGWEWAAFWLAAIKQQPVTAVVEPVEPPQLAEWFVDLRRQFSITAVPLGPSAGAECLRTLKANRILCLLCDRDLTGDGVEVDFIGERTTLPGGPATLGLRTGAPILPTAVYFDGSRHVAVIGAPLDASRQGSLREDVHRVTQALAVQLEALIHAAAPEQWHLMQPNWPSDREAMEQSRSGR